MAHLPARIRNMAAISVLKSCRQCPINDVKMAIPTNKSPTAKKGVEKRMSSIKKKGNKRTKMKTVGKRSLELYRLNEKPIFTTC